jgi:hypothetical protein
LHGASSDHVVAIPITGRPSNTSDENPWLRIHARWFIPARPVAANHVALRLPVVPGLLVVMILCNVPRRPGGSPEPGRGGRTAREPVRRADGAQTCAAGGRRANLCGGRTARKPVRRADGAQTCLDGDGAGTARQHARLTAAG